MHTDVRMQTSLARGAASQQRSTHRIRKAKDVGNAQLLKSAILDAGDVSDLAFLPCAPDAWRASGEGREGRGMEGRRERAVAREADGSYQHGQ